MELRIAKNALQIVLGKVEIDRSGLDQAFDRLFDTAVPELGDFPQVPTVAFGVRGGPGDQYTIRFRDELGQQ
jgi:hypothetical protein